MSATIHYELGQTVDLNFICDRTFPCFKMVPNRNGDGKYTKKSSIIIITDTAIVELAPFPHLEDSATVADVHELAGLEKLKFKKGESSGSVFVHFKGSFVSTYLMKDPMVCVEVIKGKMSQLGLEGKSLRKAMYVENAMSCLESCKAVETQFSLTPTLRLVDEMMDLMRRATEKFGEADENEGYAHVVKYTQSFLQRPDVIQLLDSTVQPKAVARPSTAPAAPAAAAAAVPSDSLAVAAGRSLGLEVSKPAAVAADSSHTSAPAATPEILGSAAALTTKDGGTSVAGCSSDATAGASALANMAAIAASVVTIECNSEDAEEPEHTAPTAAADIQQTATGRDEAVGSEWSSLMEDMDSNIVEMLQSLSGVGVEAAAAGAGHTSGATTATAADTTGADEEDPFDMKEFDKLFT